MTFPHLCMIQAGTVCLVPLPVWNRHVTQEGPLRVSCRAFGERAVSLIRVALLVKETWGCCATLVSTWLHLPGDRASACVQSWPARRPVPEILSIGILFLKPELPLPCQLREAVRRLLFCCRRSQFEFRVQATKSPDMPHLASCHPPAPKCPRRPHTRPTSFPSQSQCPVPFLLGCCLPHCQTNELMFFEAHDSVCLSWRQNALVSVPVVHAQPCPIDLPESCMKVMIAYTLCARTCRCSVILVPRQGIG